MLYLHAFAPLLVLPEQHLPPEELFFAPELCAFACVLLCADLLCVAEVLFCAALFCAEEALFCVEALFEALWLCSLLFLISFLLLIIER